MALKVMRINQEAMMLNNEYETKDLKPTYEAKNKTYISPKGNQYFVTKDNVEVFEAAHGVDETWTIK